MTDQTSPVTDVPQGPWQLNMTSNLQDHIPRVGQVVSGFVPRIMGPSTHHRDILNRLNSREHHPEPTHESSVVVDVDTDPQEFTPGQEENNPNLLSHDHFQIPNSSFQDRNQNGLPGRREGGGHGHAHNGPIIAFNIRNIILNFAGFLFIISLKLLSQHFYGKQKLFQILLKMFAVK